MATHHSKTNNKKKVSEDFSSGEKSGEGMEEEKGIRNFFSPILTIITSTFFRYFVLLAIIEKTKAYSHSNKSRGRKLREKSLNHQVYSRQKQLHQKQKPVQGSKQADINEFQTGADVNYAEMDEISKSK